MMSLKRLALTSVVLASTATLTLRAEEKRSPEGRGAFRVHVVVTDKTPYVFESLTEAGQDHRQIPRATSVKRGAFTAAIVFFEGCQPSFAGRCNTTVDFSVLDPRGKPYGELIARELWANKPPPRAGRSQLGVSYMVIEIEPSDPSGKYKVLVKATDHSAGTVATDQATFEVP